MDYGIRSALCVMFVTPHSSMEASLRMMAYLYVRPITTRLEDHCVPDVISQSQVDV